MANARQKICGILLLWTVLSSLHTAAHARTKACRSSSIVDIIKSRSDTKIADAILSRFPYLFFSFLDPSLEATFFLPTGVCSDRPREVQGGGKAVLGRGGGGTREGGEGRGRERGEDGGGAVLTTEPGCWWWF